MNKSIWSPKGQVFGTCVKIPYNGYEISIAMDDNLGCYKEYSRSNLRVFRDWDGKDVTNDFYKDGGTCEANAYNLRNIFSMIDMYGDRD